MEPDETEAEKTKLIERREATDKVKDADQALLDAIGGEPLEGSGFENEKPDEGFIAPPQNPDPA